MWVLTWQHACHEANCLCDITAWMPVGEGLIAWIGTIHWNLYFSLLASSKLQTIFQTNGYAMLCSKLGDLVYTCMLCASRSKLANNQNKNTCVLKSKISCLVQADLRIGRAGVLIKWPSPIVPKFPSWGNFGDDGHVAFGTSQGFLNFPK